nr:MAG TPA: hypothetical protein [Caudoviricetes sp.]
MSYFATAVQGINASVGLRKQTKRLRRDACTAWIELTDFGYELSILGGVHFISFSQGPSRSRAWRRFTVMLGASPIAWRLCPLRMACGASSRPTWSAVALKSL